ncbi:MAG: hypothetical protein GX593_06165 [Actinomycetales bacterium]|nr:hypothetical protein [Actinomycetales bacterium]
MRRTGTPIWIGEFGPMLPNLDAEPWRLQLLRDQLEIYREHDASWALWTYKDVGLQGLRTVDPASGYLTRIADVLAAKERLGVDSWGGSDAGVRDILDPIDALFDREFPDYHPWPWGRRPHIAVLVRHILLAEPLAEEWADRFRGVTPEQAAELGRDFSFARTHERTPLADLLRSHIAES